MTTSGPTFDCGFILHGRDELENMSAAIAGEAEPLLGREDAVGQARTIAALYRSAEEGASVVL
jgi:D-xylose 1-dehydrogenase (NADP+, D-xylono-1,5-lactone-forming)